MKKLILIILVGLFSCQMKAQNYDFPPNPEPDKCYERCFDYNKRFEWKEVDCEKVKNEQHTKTKEELIACERKKIKMTKYQEKLKALGYDVDITGIADNKTIIAHHKYLKKKKRNERKIQKAAKKINTIEH